MSRLKIITEPLTQREMQILLLLVDGKLNKEIGTVLNISVDTVKKHLKNIYRKITARNRVEAVQYANSLQYKESTQIIS
ncbi:MAG: helix-turn-helix transcriptional regulator [Bacteroidota bacterium]